MSNRFSLFIAAIVLFLFCHRPDLQAWWSSGHKIVAEIAYDDLEPEVRSKVDEILKTYQGFYPEHTSFVKASTWADDIQKTDGLHFFSTGHYTNIPYDPEQILTSEDKQIIAATHKGHDVLSIILQSKKILSNENSSPFAKAVALNLLIHTVADVHQPLHSTSRHSAAHPEGDMGGNLFHIIPMEGSLASNLHQLWDSGVGAFPIIPEFNTTEEDDKNIKIYSEELRQEFPKSYFENINCLSAYRWSQESHEIAINVAYQLPENTQPSQEYIETSQKAAKERVTLAGYRLAKLLNYLFLPQGNSVNAELTDSNGS